MAFQPGYWGIDIGQCALKAVRLQLIDGKATATAFDYVEHPKILSQPDADPEQLTRESLEKFLSRNPIKGDKIAIGVAGQSGLARFVKLPPVEEKKIDDIVKFEAKQQIPFPLEEVVWDYQKVSDGAVEGGFAIDTEIGLFAMKRDMIGRVLNHFTGVNIEVHTIQMAPLALCNYVTYDMLGKGGPDGAAEGQAAALGGKRKCIVALDVGTDGSNLIITDGAKIIWQRPIPIGGNHFTRALTKELKLTFAKAEHLKRNAAKSPELANILKALKPVLTDFVGEVQRSLGYFTNTHRDAQIEYLVGVGSAFKLPGLQKYLGDKLQLRVEKPTKFQRLVGESVTNAPVFIDNILTFPVAYGLALQSLGAGRLRTNLLPPEITLDRKIRAKKPWAVAAAACLLLGTGIWAYGYAGQYASANDPRIKESLGKNEAANKEAAKVVEAIKAKQIEVNTATDKVLAIIAGTEERMNWLRINEYINDCLPVPGPAEKGGNMVASEAVIELWKNSEGGERATEKYFERIKKGIDPKLAYKQDDMREFLPAVDIEAVHCRYTRDLSTYFKNAKDYCLKYVGLDLATFSGMEKSERDPMMLETPVFPTGAGWVFEIRGTTWYERGTTKGPELLKMTLLPNLKKLSKESQDPAIKGKVSHIFLYNTWKDEAPRQDSYHFIYKSLIDYLMPGAAPAVGETPGVIAQPAATAGPPPWKPLSKSEVGKAAAVGADAGAANPYQRTLIPRAPKKDDTGEKSESKEEKKAANKPRYEFVILFVWSEPVPSDRFSQPATAPLPTLRK